MPHLIVGTAGHIDHGKSALVKALTGTDPDRLPAEKERGMTIDLGYAHLSLPNGQEAGIVDVPGHERFIKNMLAGATGVDLALLVVAADDSVMPQTVEHLQILDLLEVQRGLVVVTKIDLVDEETLALVEEEVTELLEGRKLEGSAICYVSSITGQGIEELRTRLGEELAGFTKVGHRAHFRLPVDRSFSMSGFGCVVTGTVTGGAARLGDEVEVLPVGQTVKIRGLQVHGADSELAEEGQRAALNLSGIKANDVTRGCQISAPGRLHSSSFLAAELFFLQGNRRPLKNFTKVRLHLGTVEVLARIVFLDRSARLGAGETALVQLRLDEPVVADRDDRFVVRIMSPQRTIGGGRVLLVGDAKISRFQSAMVHYLKSLGEGDARKRVEAELARPRSLPPTIQELSGELGVSEEELSAYLSELGDNCITYQEGRTKRFVHSQTLEWLVGQIEGHLRKFHEKRPILLGLHEDDVRRQFPEEQRGQLLALVIDRGIREGRLGQTGRCLHLGGRAPTLSKNAEAIRSGMLGRMRERPFETPRPKDLIAYFDPTRESEEVYLLLLQTGQVVEIANGVALLAETLEHAKSAVKGRIEERGEITVGDVRDLLGTSRKYALPLMEYLDEIGFTERVEDKRILKNSGEG